MKLIEIRKVNGAYEISFAPKEQWINALKELFRKKSDLERWEKKYGNKEAHTFTTTETEPSDIPSFSELVEEKRKNEEFRKRNNDKYRSAKKVRHFKCYR